MLIFEHVLGYRVSFILRDRFEMERQLLALKELKDPPTGKYTFPPQPPRDVLVERDEQRLLSMASESSARQDWLEDVRYLNDAFLDGLEKKSSTCGLSYELPAFPRRLRLVNKQFKEEMEAVDNLLRKRITKLLDVSTLGEGVKKRFVPELPKEKGVIELCQQARFIVDGKNAGSYKAIKTLPDWVRCSIRWIFLTEVFLYDNLTGILWTSFSDIAHMDSWKTPFPDLLRDRLRLQRYSVYMGRDLDFYAGMASSEGMKMLREGEIDTLEIIYKQKEPTDGKGFKDWGVLGEDPKLAPKNYIARRLSEDEMARRGVYSSYYWSPYYRGWKLMWEEGTVYEISRKQRPTRKQKAKIWRRIGRALS
ncbi:hypothetical protein ABW19_dt0204144 [Dactylella cylindrospora]|nr:hypothetical protein ABW19_dt0204144 [Dactylella cylindrospora]